MRFDIWQTRREDEYNRHYLDKNGNLAVNVYHGKLGDSNTPIVAMFIGKALKPKYYYSFKNELDAFRFIKTRAEYELNKINDKIDERAVEKEFKKNYKTSLKVGDIMHGSWGYDMTFNEFYQITEIKNKTVILREVAMDRKAVGFYEDVRPQANSFVGEPIKRILQVRYLGKDRKPYEYIKLSDVCNLTLCEDINRYYYENHND